MLSIDSRFLCVTKKKDGTYLIGIYDNQIYQLYFDKYGFPEVVSKVDSGYGYYEDRMECMYSHDDSRYYGVKYIEECKNGDILTVSDLYGIKKFWKY